MHSYTGGEPGVNIWKKQVQNRRSFVELVLHPQCQKHEPHGWGVVVVVVVVVVAWTHGVSTVSHSSCGSRMGVSQPQSGQARMMVSNASPSEVDHKQEPVQPGPGVVVALSSHGSRGPTL
jgi:hypothetical protein